MLKVFMVYNTHINKNRVIKNLNNAKFSTHRSLRCVSGVLESRLGTDKHIPEKIIRLSGHWFLSTSYVRIVSNYLIFQKYEVNLNLLQHVAICLRLHTATLEHRILLLQELGVCHLNATLIAYLDCYMKQKEQEFKKIAGIPIHQNIAENVFECLGRNPPKVSPANQLGDNPTVHDIYHFCLSHYESETLQQPILTDYLKNYSNYYSFRIFGKSLNLLLKDIRLDETFVKKNAIVFLYMCPYNAEAIWTILKSLQLDDVGPEEIVRKWPSVLLCNPHNVKLLLKCFAVNGFKQSLILTCPKILGLDAQIFDKRYKNIKQIKSVSKWNEHPRMFGFIFRYEQFYSRILYLYLTKKSQFLNIYMLTCEKGLFERLLNTNMDTRTRRRLFRRIIRMELSANVDYLDQQIDRHPHWDAAFLADIYSTIVWLKESFTAADICQNIHIICYPRSKIMLTLKRLYEQHMCTYTPSQYLALCLYEMEKQCNFSGNGVYEVFDYKDVNRVPELQQVSLLNHYTNETDVERTVYGPPLYITEEMCDFYSNQMFDHNMCQGRITARQ